MGSVDRTDKTLPLNEMMFYVRKSKDLRDRWNTDLAGLCREFGVSQAEYEALKAKGRGDRDHSAILTFVEDQAHHEVGKET